MFKIYKYLNQNDEIVALINLITINWLSKLRKIMNAFKNLTDILGLEKIRVLYLALIKYVQNDYKLNKKKY